LSKDFEDKLRSLLELNLLSTLPSVSSTICWIFFWAIFLGGLVLDNLNIGQLLFSNLFQKRSLMFIFVQLIKVILNSSYHYIIHSKSMLPSLFPHNMVYVANSYKMTIPIFATNYRLLQNNPYDY